MIYASQENTLCLVAALLLVAACAAPPQAPATSLTPSASTVSIKPTPAEIAAAVDPSVVTIHGYANDQAVSSGTGFFIRDDGTIVTNMHVVVDAETLKVELSDGEMFDDVYVLAGDDERDLIILQIATSGTRGLNIADDRDLRIGDTVYVVGNPLGLQSTFSDGLVSGKRTHDGVNYLQITAPISKGSSGGPVLNSDGDVVGVATSYFEGGQNLNMAVPARHAAGLLTMAGTPELFDDIMARILAEEAAEPQAQVTSDRASETSELLASLPAETQARLGEVSEYSRQAMVRMLAYGAVAEVGGYSMSDYSLAGALESDDVAWQTFVLPRGNYLAIGSCDNDCVDLDVIILDIDGDIVVEDRDNDADSVVSFDLLKPQSYTVGVHMVDCAATDCVYYVQLFKQ